MDGRLSLRTKVNENVREIRRFTKLRYPGLTPGKML